MVAGASAESVKWPLCGQHGNAALAQGAASDDAAGVVVLVALVQMTWNGPH